MIEELAVEVLKKMKRTWKVDGNQIEPTEEDVSIVLDKAAEELVNQPDIDVLTVGGLKIERNDRGRFDVYVHIGEYI
jgi:hypothetical protein